MDLSNHSLIVSFIWGVADLIRDSFKRGHYQDVILPLTVLRRLDCVMTASRQDVRETYLKLKDKLDNLDPQLRKAGRQQLTGKQKNWIDAVTRAIIRRVGEAGSTDQLSNLNMGDFPPL